MGVADGVFGAAVAEGELGFDAARAKDADPEAVGAEFGIESLGEADLGELGGAVDALVGRALQAGDGGDEEDSAGAAFDHVRGGVAAEEEAGAQVGGDEGVEVLGRGLDERLVVSCPGVVDKDVELTEALDGQGDGGLRGGFEGSVSGVIDSGGAEGGDFGAELLEALFAAGYEDEAGSLVCEGERGGTADAGACSCDEGCFAGEVHRYALDGTVRDAMFTRQTRRLRRRRARV